MVLFPKVDLAQKVGQLQRLYSSLLTRRWIFSVKEKRFKDTNGINLFCFTFPLSLVKNLKLVSVLKLFLASMIPFVYPQMLDKAENVQRSSLF